VGNGAACGTFLARAIRVNMDPLSISSACRELVTVPAVSKTKFEKQRLIDVRRAFVDVKAVSIVL
jgi:hypothetical protein